MNIHSSKLSMLEVCMRVINHLLKAIRDAAVFNPEVQVAPACILWPDRDRQWETVIDRLQTELPELFVLGEYSPAGRTGPAIWLRCVLANTVDDVPAFERTPIFYLPGISRQDLRAVESCAAHLKPLAELQYRGVIWSQQNGKDWTILAYLKSDQGGLNLDVAQDSPAKNAMQLALSRLLEEEVELLKGKRLDKDYFHTLLTGGDPTRDLLQWLDRGEEFKAARPESEWKAFVEVCKSQLGFYPDSEGVLTGAMKLAEHEGPWQAVWDRFCEAPGRYSNLPGQIRKCKAPTHTIYWHSGDKAYDGWPQWNQDQEQLLRRDLLDLAKVPAHEARKKLLSIEKKHGKRRMMVWAELGEAPLACALEHLAVVAEITANSLAAGAIDDLMASYSGQGWKADDGVLKALACVEKIDDIQAVQVLVHALYLPWLEESARYLQKRVDGSTYPGGTSEAIQVASYGPGECIFFVDGLRFDNAKRLIELLESKDFTVEAQKYWAPLPTVTSTGKPFVTPLLGKFEGQYGNVDFEPVIAETGQALTGYHLKKLFKAAGWAVLERFENGDGGGNAWCEFGDVDHEGHDRGWKLAKHLDTLLTEVRDRIASLLVTGWKKIHVVTDHGWLLMPGGLPKLDLPAVLTESKWGRCAALKPGVDTDERLYPWFWNPQQYFALADGVSCFKNGVEYTHGGLSLQECLLLKLAVTQVGREAPAGDVEITDVVWKGMRCTVAADGNFTGLSLDIRIHAGDSESSVALAVKKLKTNGSASIVIEDEDLSGKGASVVLIDRAGSLVAQLETVIGGEA